MSNFVKGQTVTLTNPNTQLRVSGVLNTSTVKTLQIIFEHEDGLNSITSNAWHTPQWLIAKLNIRPHEGTPISDKLQARINDLNGLGPKFSKGDIVGFQHNGKAHTGRVIKGGSKPQVTYTLNYAMNIPAKQLSPATAPNVDPELAEWDVIKMADNGMGRGFPMFTATVARNGKAVFEARCLGDGGVLRYDRLKNGSQKDINDWKAAVQAYVESKGCESAIPDELWPEYAWEMKPTGMTFEHYLNNLHKL